MLSNYLFKVLVALLDIPLYLLVNYLRRYLELGR